MKRHSGAELSVVAVCVVIGFLVAVQLKSVKINSEAAQTNAGRLETLQELYNDVVGQRDDLQAELTQVNAELARYRDSAAHSTGQGEALMAEAQRLAGLAGLTDVEGPGVSVVLKDSTVANTGGSEADYIVHDSDLLTVINDLRDAGAEALSLNGERILATSEIRCAGSVVIVNGRRYAAPFVVFAIGNPDTLYQALTMRGGVVDVLGQWRIDVNVTMSNHLTIPKYSGALEFTYAKPPVIEDEGEEDGL